MEMIEAHESKFKEEISESLKEEDCMAKSIFSAQGVHSGGLSQGLIGVLTKGFIGENWWDFFEILVKI